MAVNFSFHEPSSTLRNFAALICHIQKSWKVSFAVYAFKPKFYLSIKKWKKKKKFALTIWKLCNFTGTSLDGQRNSACAMPLQALHGVLKFLTVPEILAPQLLHPHLSPSTCSRTCASLEHRPKSSSAMLNLAIAVIASPFRRNCQFLHVFWLVRPPSMFTVAFFCHCGWVIQLKLFLFLVNP